MKRFFLAWANIGISLNHYLSSGFLPFVPYLFIYICGWLLSISTTVLFFTFWTLHFFHLFLLFNYLRTQLRTIRRYYFWIFLLALLLIPGAYMEFPSDPWEHIRRIFAWSSVSTITNYDNKEKFAYFFSWTLLSPLPISLRTTGLDFLSGFWQFVMLYQWFRVIKHFETERRWQYLHVAGLAFLFGHNVFGIRYYGLSSTPLAFVGYFAFLEAFLCARKTHRAAQTTPYLVAAFFLALFNHVQCIIYILLVPPAWHTYDRIKQLSRSRKIKCGYLALGLYVGSLFLGWYCFHYFPQIYSRMSPDVFSPLGTFRIWAYHSRFTETWGVHGIIAICLSLLFFKSFPLPSIATLSPILLLIFPPAVIFMARAFNIDVPYRLLYAAPSSLMILLVTKRLVVNSSLERHQLLIGTAVLLAISAPYTFPWRGRLWFQLYRPHPRRDMRALSQTAQWLHDHRQLDSNCVIWMDDTTGFVVTSISGLKQVAVDHSKSLHPLYGRLDPYHLMKRRKSAKQFRDWVNDIEFCGILVLDISRYPGTPKSSVSESSQHWFSYQGDLIQQWDPEFYFRVERMVRQQDWTREEVPPFYILYSPPKNGRSWWMDDTQSLDYKNLTKTEIESSIPKTYKRYYFPWDPLWLHSKEGPTEWLINEKHE